MKFKFGCICWRNYLTIFHLFSRYSCHFNFLYSASNHEAKYTFLFSEFPIYQITSHKYLKWTEKKTKKKVLLFTLTLIRFLFSSSHFRWFILHPFSGEIFIQCCWFIRSFSFHTAHRSFSQRRITSSAAYFVLRLTIATERLFYTWFWIVLYFPLTS